MRAERARLNVHGEGFFTTCMRPAHEPIMTSACRSLLDHRLIVVTGKGGVGKTTVGLRAGGGGETSGETGLLLAETDPIESVAFRFEAQPAPLGYAGRPLRPGLHALRLDPHEALADYVRLQTGLGAVTDRILQMEIFSTTARGRTGLAGADHPRKGLAPGTEARRPR